MKNDNVVSTMILDQETFSKVKSLYDNKYKHVCYCGAYSQTEIVFRLWNGSRYTYHNGVIVNVDEEFNIIKERDIEVIYGKLHGTLTIPRDPNMRFQEPLTLQEAKELTYGTVLYHRTNRNADGTAQRWRVNGKVKTWKRDLSRVRIPIKNGMWSYDTLTESELKLLSLVDCK